MGKSLGVSAFVLLLLSIPIPVVGNFLSVFALLLAAVAATAGDRTWAVVAAIVGGIKLFFLSPSWMYLMYGSRLMQGSYANTAASEQVATTNSTIWYFTLLIVLLPIGIAVWRARHAGSEQRIQSAEE